MAKPLWQSSGHQQRDSNDLSSILNDPVPCGEVCDYKVPWITCTLLEIIT